MIRNPYNKLDFPALEKALRDLTDEEREGKKGDQIRRALRRRLKKAKRSLSIRDRIAQLLHDRGQVHLVGHREVRRHGHGARLDQLELRRRRRRAADARKRAERRAKGKQIRAERARRQAVA